jgi:DNA-binding SARP family transcriptional activator
MLFCCGDLMSRLAGLALDQDIDPAFALHLIRRHALPAPEGASERWPWATRIRCLGRFVVEHESGNLPPPRKESRKPLDLLKLTIALGGSAVRIDRLTALLWPQAEGDAAQNSFDNALHRLRKLVGEQHIVLQAGALSLNAATCWTDVAALEACLSEADALTPDTTPAAIERVAERALALCQGDFLAGDESYPELLLTRRRLRAAFVRQMSRVGALLEATGDVEAAVRVYGRVVERQPLAEAVVRRLMHCLLGLGRRAEAYEAYRDCRQQLSVVLAISPAPETESLALRLREA